MTQPVAHARHVPTAVEELNGTIRTVQDLVGGGVRQGEGVVEKIAMGRCWEEEGRKKEHCSVLFDLSVGIH